MTTDSFSLYEIARILKLPADEVVRLDNVARAKRGKKPKRTQPSAAKVRLYRQRQRLGQIVLRVVVEEHALATFLIESGRLSAAESFARPKVEAAVQERAIGPVPITGSDPDYPPAPGRSAGTLPSGASTNLAMRVGSAASTTPSATL